MAVSNELGRAYFNSRDGTRSRVHDCTFAGGRFTRCETMLRSKAASRVFVFANGVEKSDRLTKGENHELTESRIEAQHRAARYLPTETFDSSERGPR